VTFGSTSFLSLASTKSLNCAAYFPGILFWDTLPKKNKNKSKQPNKKSSISFKDIFKTFIPEKKSIVTGRGDIFFKFQGKGIDEKVYSKSLNVDGKFKIKEGALIIETTMPTVTDQMAKMLKDLDNQDIKTKLTKKDLEKAASKISNISLKNLKGNFTIKNGTFFLKEKIPMEPGLLDPDDCMKVTVFFSGTLDDVEISVDLSEIISNILLRRAKNPFQWLFDWFD